MSMDNTSKAFVEMSLTIKRAWIDPKTNEKRWRADASNIDDDKAEDNMTLELFQSFIDRIENGELVPETYRSDYWQGGMPYLSISHYPDLNGKAVPGPVDAVYIDGKYLKAKGRFFDTPLGAACWKSVCEDLERTKRGEAFDDKIRVSIAFLDYAHKHKSNGFMFTRGKLDDVCPECLREIVEGEKSGRSFMDGHLIHLAMTRVPMANGLSEFEPDMEVERSMTTRKEDAVSIVKDEELVAEIDQDAKLVGKSEALVIKAKESEKEDEEDMEDEEEEEKGCGNGKKMKKSETDEEPVVVAPAVDLSEVFAKIDELKSMISVPAPVEPTPHILDGAIAQLKSQYDEIAKADTPSDEKLRLIQQPFNELGQAIIHTLRPEEVAESNVTASNDIVKSFSEALRPLYEKMDMIIAQTQPRTDQPTGIPSRRSISPANTLIQQSQQTSQPGKPNSIHDVVMRSVGLG